MSYVEASPPPLGVEPTSVDAPADPSGFMPTFYREIGEPVRPIQYSQDDVSVSTEDHRASKVGVPGITRVGTYHNGDEELPIYAISYNKLDSATGEPETLQRMVIGQGWGEGVHPGHYGQAPDLYLIGVEIGKYDPDQDTTSLVSVEGKTLEPKHFSVACTVDGKTKTVLANRSQAYEKAIGDSTWLGRGDLLPTAIGEQVEDATSQLEQDGRVRLVQGSLQVRAHIISDRQSGGSQELLVDPYDRAGTGVLARLAHTALNGYRADTWSYRQLLGMPPTIVHDHYDSDADALTRRHVVVTPDALPAMIQMFQRDVAAEA